MFEIKKVNLNLFTNQGVDAIFTKDFENVYYFGTDKLAKTNYEFYGKITPVNGQTYLRIKYIKYDEVKWYKEDLLDFSMGFDDDLKFTINYDLKSINELVINVYISTLDVRIDKIESRFNTEQYNVKGL